MDENGFSFGIALSLLRKGFQVRRAAWDHKDIWIALQEPDDQSKLTLPYIYIEYPAGNQAHPQGCRMPWFATHADILAYDWDTLQ